MPASPTATISWRKRKKTPGPYVGAVLEPRVRQGKFFGVSRRRPSPNGEFTGVVMVAVEPQIFTDFYTQLARDAGGGGFSLAKSDGVILARYPDPPNGITRFGPDSGFMLNVPRYPNGAVVTTNHSVDGVQRRIAFRKLGYSNLYVSDGVATDTIIADWLRYDVGASLFRHSRDVIVLLCARADDDAPHARSFMPKPSAANWPRRGCGRRRRWKPSGN